MTNDHPFWQFSVHHYAVDGVASACLALQEQCGIDVNLLLFCCYGGRQGKVFTTEQIDQCRTVVDPWHSEIAKGLRAVRQRLKSGFDFVQKNQTEPLRQKILGMELEAEKIEQVLLAEAVPIDVRSDIPSGKAKRAAAANIALYFEQADIKNAPEQDQHLEAILSACFPNA